LQGQNKNILKKKNRDRNHGFSNQANKNNKLA